MRETIEKIDKSGSGDFTFYMPLKKSGGIITKKASDGTDDFYLVGIATNSEIDKDDEFMSAKFLKKTAPEMIGMTVFFEHDTRLDKTVGIITDAQYIDGAIEVEVFLEKREKNIYVDQILNKNEIGIKIGFSVGGRITSIQRHKSDTMGREIRELEDGEIYELSVCGIPSNYSTFASAVSKVFNKNKTNTEVVETVIEKRIADDVENFDNIVELQSLHSALYAAFNIYSDMMYEILFWSGLDMDEKLNLGNELFGKFEAIVAELLSTISMK